MNGAPTEDALAGLHSLGARFVALLKLTKVAYEEGWIDRGPKPLATAIGNFRRSGCLGIEPASLGHVVVDVDCGQKPDGTEPTADERLAIVRSIIDWFDLKQPPTGVFPSASCHPIDKGKRHIWIPCDPQAEAPLGYSDSSGEPRKASTNLRWDGHGGWQSFDIRFRNSYVAFDSYAPALLRDMLAHRYWQAAGRIVYPNAKLRGLDIHGQRNKPPKTVPARSLPRPRGPGLNQLSREEGERRAWNYVHRKTFTAATIAREVLAHMDINNLGFMAGKWQERNPHAEGVFLHFLRAQGVPETRIQYYFYRGFNDA